MHRPILGVALIAAAAWSAAAREADAPAPAECPRDSHILVERFIDADCTACWTETAPTSPVRAPWTIDWIVPSARGDDAALASAALGEAQDRLQRQPGGALQPDGRTERRTTLSARPLRLSVVAGPAWNGYIGLQLGVRGTWPRASSGWMALVEAVPVGTDGTPVARRLARAVAGPLDLDTLREGGSVLEFRALRWPETAMPARLRAFAWVEGRDGRILAVAGERCPSARPR